MYLFPIAALLLLLSGVGTSAQGVGDRTAAAFMRGILGEQATVQTGSLAHVAFVRATTRFAPKYAEQTHLALTPTQCAVAGLPREDRLSWRQTHYRTRFSCASSVYLALGPPDVLSGPGPRWI